MIEGDSRDTEGSKGRGQVPGRGHGAGWPRGWAIQKGRDGRAGQGPGGDGSSIPGDSGRDGPGGLEDAVP